ncbi:rhodanese-like domain-containing protein [Fontimonas sp. SYSU GA230001]|uniref:rhodanese-like domain-containing protein n=1 Tax=Fontimonas sp. SYSU GA230001 TaxID=3142450 RepID=UPI0032B50479
MSQFVEFLGNHPGLFAALGVVLLLIVANEVHGAFTGGKRLSVAEAVRLINDRDPIILDVRTPADFKKGHLLNAHNAPLTKLDESLGAAGKDKSKPVLVYCALGPTSVSAAERLRKLGFAEVYPLRGGLNAWLGASLPVTAK